MTTSLLGLESKGALVLGGGQGMGEATVMQLARAGCRIAVLDLELSRAQTVVAKVEAEGGTAFAIAADALNDEKLKAAIIEADEKLGGIDVMATVIGMAAWASLLDMTEQTWDTDQQRNLRYFFVAGKTTAGLMLKRGKPGSIVCVTSIDGIRSSPYHGSYGAAKAGLINLVKTMAVEWSPRGIRVNAIAPGGTVSPRIPRGDDESERKMSEGVPMGRRGDGDGIAKAALFFLSEMSSFVTGQTLAVDGGYLAASLFDYGKLSGVGPSGGVPAGTTMGVKS